MSKSFVTMETKQCPVCGDVHQTNSLLLDERMREKFDMETCTGWQMCEEHQQIIDAGYVIMVGALTPPPDVNRLELGEAERTGDVIFLQRTAAEQIFDCELEDMNFVDPDVIAYLQNLKAQMEDHDGTTH